MPVTPDQFAGFRPIWPPVPGVGPIVHFADHGSCIIAVRWDGEQSIPWVRLVEDDAEWYRIAIH